ncbi:unnamed protein product [Timema podura]|uniref:DUF659 domain-containing protein n=1 Tax=Timema podura TaxID=61482 RepID=A0ABN7NR59_TIMPD|nr:unnamed protein product [Timema podura]
MKLHKNQQWPNTVEMTNKEMIVSNDEVASQDFMKIKILLIVKSLLSDKVCIHLYTSWGPAVLHFLPEVFFSVQAYNSIASSFRASDEYSEDYLLFSGLLYSPFSTEVSTSAMDTPEEVEFSLQSIILETHPEVTISNFPVESMAFDTTQENKEYAYNSVLGGGDLPKAETIRSVWIPEVNKSQEDNIKNNVKNQQVAILCDETTDRKGQCVFVILLKTLRADSKQSLFVGAVKVLQNASATECSRALVDTITKYEIPYENVVCVVTDGARYMTKCVTSLKVLLCDDFLHIQCWDHKLNLVQNYWSVELPELNECVAKAKAAFLNTRKRKHNYLAFLNEKYSKGEKSAKLFPNPVLTRWNSWFCSVVYLCEYLVDLVEYFSTLEEVTAALKYFQDMSHDKSLFSAEVSTGAIDTPEEVAFSLQSIILETHPEVTISDNPLETMAFDTTQENKESPLSTEVSTSAMDTPKEVALSLESIILETHPEVTNSNYPVESTAFDITHKNKESASFPSEVLTSVVDSLEDSLSLKPVTLRINPEVNISSKLVTDVNKTKEDNQTSTRMDNLPIVQQPTSSTPVVMFSRSTASYYPFGKCKSCTAFTDARMRISPDATAPT